MLIGEFSLLMKVDYLIMGQCHYKKFLSIFDFMNDNNRKYVILL